jgi:hypothetical protein
MTMDLTQESNPEMWHELATTLQARVKTLEEWQEKALDYFPKPLRVDAAFVARVEERMGHGHESWDTVDPVALCKAILLESGR